MFKPRLRRTDPFAAALVVLALTLAGLAVMVGLSNLPAAVALLVTAGLIGALGFGVQRAVGE
ncbi:hypothetical protein [Bosea sp. (in: a-proteobacteria)]|uniref:hypothetical protein n=1 Tax=Bosea sp. (in: a-proteobacteria) TaxID=1871050 RepID=UPI00260D6780|nr:hypothetical protein [Bosea sp. (in: a-proteobacteria)]MCO5091972.1 hypothetical protein [Bosea sp. (in: a-proteobacteria)]